jgi:hypothetical protein
MIISLNQHDQDGKLSLISLRFCHLVMLVMGNYHWFPSDFVTWLCWLWLIIIEWQSDKIWGKSMTINHNQHDQVPKSEGNQWQLSIANMTKDDHGKTIIVFPQTLSRGHVEHRTTVGENSPIWIKHSLFLSGWVFSPYQSYLIFIVMIPNQGNGPCLQCNVWQRFCASYMKIQSAVLEFTNFFSRSHTHFCLTKLYFVQSDGISEKTGFLFLSP